MKKLLSSLAIATIFSVGANAQDATNATSETRTVNKKPPFVQERIEKRKEGSSSDQQNSNSQEKPRSGERREKFENASPEEREKMKDDFKNKREERFNNASPEQKARMEKRREVMEKLTPDQKKAAKAEMERHRAAMKQIVGQDLMPPMPEEGGQR